MKSLSKPIHASCPELAERLTSAMQAAQAIRSDVALTICESTETRMASRHLRADFHRQVGPIATGRRKRDVRTTVRAKGIAQIVAEMLSGHGYSAFVVAPAQDTASLQ